MSTPPPRGAGRDAEAAARALARDLVDQIAAIATPPPGAASAPSSAAAPAAAGAPGLDLSWSHQLLENGSRYVAPVLPAGATLRPVKKLVLRALRIVTRDQTVYNSAVAEALRTALEEIRKGHDALGAWALAVGASHAEAAEREAKGDTARLRDEVRAALAAEASARGALTGRLEAEVGRLASASEEAARRQSARDEDLANRLAAVERSSDEIRGPIRDEASRLSASLADALRRLDATDAAAASLREELRLLRLEIAALRSAAPRTARPEPRAEVGVVVPADPTDPLEAGLYAEFERRFRGSEDEIRSRQRADVALFRGVPGPVVDLGCGRGEFLEVLREAGITGAGCDSNPVMAARAKEKGLEVEHADLFGFLGEKADASLGGVTAYQVVEHLPPAALARLVALAAVKLAPGGRLLLETVNPESVYAMKWFWMDLTHVRPVPGPSLAQLLSVSGFRDVDVLFRSPVPAADAIPADAAARPDLSPVARLLFGPQDVAVTGLR